MRFYWPIAKVDAEQRMVWGYASTEALDEQGEIVKREALEAALGDYMRFANIREMHQPSAVGVAKEATIDDRGLYLAAKIVDDEAWEKVVQGVYQGVLDRRPRNGARSGRPQHHHRACTDRNLGGGSTGQSRGGVRLLEGLGRRREAREPRIPVRCGGASLGVRMIPDTIIAKRRRRTGASASARLLRNRPDRHRKPGAGAGGCG